MMCTIWALHFVIIKIAVEEIPPLFYAAIRMSVVAILLSPFLRLRRGQMLRILAAGACLGGLNYAFMFTGLANAPASAAALAIELYVPFATVLSVIFLGEKVGAKRITGMAMAFAGVAIIALFRDSVGGDDRVGIGIIFICAAALFEAAGAVIIKKTRGIKPLELLAWFAMVGTVILWVATNIAETGQVAALKETNGWLIAGAILYSAIGGSIIGHTSYYWLLQRLPLSLLAPSGLLTTLLAVLFAVVFLREDLTVPIIIGGLMIMLGVGTVIVRSSNQNETKFIKNANPKR